MWKCSSERGGPDSGPSPSCPQSDPLVPQIPCAQWMGVTQELVVCPHSKGKAFQYSRGDSASKSWAPSCEIMRPEIGFSYWDELFPSSEGEDTVRPPSEWNTRDDLAKCGLGWTRKAPNTRATCWVPDPSQAELFLVSVPRCGLRAPTPPAVIDWFTSFLPLSGFLLLSIFTKREESCLWIREWSLSRGMGENGRSLIRKSAQSPLSALCPCFSNYTLWPTRILTMKAIEWVMTRIFYITQKRKY